MKNLIYNMIILYSIVYSIVYTYIDDYKKWKKSKVDLLVNVNNINRRM